MKFVALLIATLSMASAFAPLSTQGRVSTTELNALFDNIAGMDLFDRDGNKYGARAKKNLKSGSIGSSSYVPAGLSAAEYAKIRAQDEKKKDASYKKNVAKAGKYQDFTTFYLARGTSEGGSWLKAPARGHTMVKTKYDFSGQKADAKIPEAFKGTVFGKK